VDAQAFRDGKLILKLGASGNLADDGRMQFARKAWRKETVMMAGKLRMGLVAVGMALVLSVGAQGQIVPGHAHIYPTIDAAEGDIHAALVEAHRTHKRVILDFGGDWCGDCQVLNIYFHQSPNAELLQKNFVLVDVNIGHFDANLEIAHKYGVPVTKGVPALSVLDDHGKVVYAQTNEFADMRNMQPTSVTEFLNKWKP
jgi:thiol:disulfide interchange protein